MSDDARRINAALADIGVAKFLSALGIKGRGNGTRARFACAIHGGDGLSASMTIRDGALVWHCFSGCSSGGDALSLIASMRGYDLRENFRDVLAEAASIAGVGLGESSFTPRQRIAPPPEDPAVIAARIEAAQGVKRILAALLELAPLEGEGLRYLTEDRGLTRATCEKARVGYLGDAQMALRVLLASFPYEALEAAGIVYGGRWLAHERHPLLFPILHGGVPVYLQGRALGPVAKKQDRWRSCRGSVPSLYNPDALERTDVPALLLEGPIDTLSAMQWVPDVAPVGVFGAGGFKAEWAAPLRGRDVWVALDPDEAGEKGAVETMRELVKAGAWPRRLAMPPGMDMNDWMLAEAA
jgi:DNA primase